MLKSLFKYVGVIYLTVLLILGFLPMTIYFVNSITVYIYYFFEIILLFIGLYLSKLSNNKISFNTNWLFLIIILFTSIIGIIFYNNFNPKIFGVFFNYLLLLFNCSLLYVNIDNLKHDYTKFLFVFSSFFIIILILGLLQYFNIINFKYARSEYFTVQNDLLVKSNRATSIFREPSSWAYLYALIFFHFVFKNKKFIFFILVLLSLYLSNSGTGYFLILLQIVFYIFNILDNKSYLYKYVILLFFIILLTFVLSKLNFNNYLISKLLFQNNDYRTLAPIETLNILFTKRIPTLLFGNGVFSLNNFIYDLNLGETATTTQNLYVDVLFELGIIGFLLYLIIILKSYNNRYDLLILLAFISQLGYRSYLFLLVLFFFKINKKILE